MNQHGRLILILISLTVCLSGCVGTIWTGVNTVYDRHHLYKKFDDFHLLVSLNNLLALHKTFDKPYCVIDMAVFNGDILLAGHLPSIDLMDELNRRLRLLKGYRRLFNEITIKQTASNSIQDSWMTTKIRSQIIADASIEPTAFKITTSDKIVYLMGEVKKEEAEKVIKIARFTKGVERVVKLFKYYTYE